MMNVGLVLVAYFKSPANGFSSLVVGFVQGWEGRYLQGNLWYSLPASMTSRLASLTFKIGEQSVRRREGEKFRFYHGNTVPIS